jgi:hypothetical protein
VCATARGDALLLLTRAADVWAARLPRAPVTAVLVPLLARAADQGERKGPLFSLKPLLLSVLPSPSPLTAAMRSWGTPQSVHQRQADHDSSMC